MLKSRINQALPYNILILAITCLAFGTAILPAFFSSVRDGVFFGVMLFFLGLLLLGRAIDQLPEIIANLNLSPKTNDWHNLLIGGGLLAPIFISDNNPGILVITMFVAALICVLASTFGFTTILFKQIAQASLPLQPEYLVIKITLLISMAIPLVYWLTKGFRLAVIYGLIGLLSYALSLVYTRKIQLYVFFKSIAFASGLGLLFHIGILMDTGLNDTCAWATWIDC